MQIHTDTQGAVTVVRPVGPLVGPDADQFRAQLTGALRSSTGRLVVELSGVPYADSKGLEALLDVAELMWSAGRALPVAAATETLREAFDVTGISSRIQQHRDAHEAVRSIP